MSYISTFLSNLFDANPGQTFRYYEVLAVIAAILIIGGIVFGQIYNKKRKADFAFKRLFKKVSSQATLLGILFVLLIGFRYENIPYFSMRIWIYLSLLTAVYATYHYVRVYLKVYPTEKQNAQKKVVVKTEKRYLPNKKK